MKIITGKQKSPQKVVLYGPEGIGKSTFASKFPDPLFIDTEGSTKHLDVKRTEPPKTWEELMKQVKYVSENPGICKTLIIDTADWAERLCSSFTCRKGGKHGIEDFGYGKGYKYLSEDFELILHSLDNVINSGAHVVLTAHAILRKFELPDEMGSFDKWELKLTKHIFPLLKEWADMLLFANYKTFVVTNDDGKGKAQGGKRVLYATHTPTHDAKNRCGLPDEMPFEYESIKSVIDENMVDSVQAKYAAVLEEPQQEDPFEDDQDIVQIPEGIPEELWTLMTTNNVTESEIRKAVSQKGYYDEKIPIKGYDDKFISGVLIKAWDKVFKLIKKNRGE